MKRLLLLLPLLGSPLFSSCAHADATVVPVGKGSYASEPPPEAPAAVKAMLTRQVYVVGNQKRPLPTNHWWTNLLVDRYAGQLWAFPHQLKADKDGLQLTYPVKWNNEGRDPVSDFPLSIGGADFHPADARAKNWGDWTLTFREAESADKYLDVTLGRGLPYVWIECHGVAPLIKAGADAACFDDGGAAAAMPLTGDHFGLDYGGRSYGVFAPEGTRFTRDGATIKVEFAGVNTFLVLCPLPGHKDLAAFHRFAYAVPRDSRLTYQYDPERAQVATTWHLETEPLQGTERRLIQGWLPHHTRDTTNDLQLNGMEFLTPRGTMRCATGTDFHLTYGFNGIPPSLPAPHPLGLPHDFDEARMRDYLSRYATQTDYGNDTYWGGKRLTQFAQYMWMAREMKDPSFDKLRDSLRAALTDWLTYTPGEKAHYFTRYPNWGALVGMEPSYGSEGFNDHHFHYGYFTTSAALLGMVDPQFLKDYRGMARLVAKDYANWDRNDPNFPLFRTFDIWEGHSWAGGTSSPTGNNQESSSEAMQGWSGVFLLGTALNDKDMQAAGATGYAMESRAAMEYWFNVHGDNFSPNYQHPIAGMVWSGGLLYGTYFSGDPAWIYGIQWLPMSPALSYLVKDPAFARKSFQAMMAEQEKKSGKSGISPMGPALGNVILGQWQQFDPDAVAAQLDDLWAANDPVARANDTPGLTYYQTHANRMLGQIQWDMHLSLPLSRVYYDPRTKTTSYVAYNPSAQPQQATVYKSAQKFGEITVPSQTLVRETHLNK